MTRPLCVGLLVLLGGCSGEGLELDGSSPTPAPAAEDCVGAEAYVAGVSAVSTLGHTVALVTATPTPPDVDDNSWSLQVDDASGTPVEGLSVDVVPWMPLHEHGLVPARYSASDEGSGSYDVDTFDLIMPGLWEFTVDLGGGTGEDTALFAFCAEG